MPDDAGQGLLDKDQIRYFLYLNGRWRWRPTKAMRAQGFGLVTMGRGGPGRDANGDPAPSSADQQRAIDLNRAWDKVQSGKTSPPARTTLVTYPPGSVGDGYQRAMALRKAERLTKGIVLTKEQESRDDWPRAWKWLGPEFGDCDPKTIIPEHFLRIDELTGKASGLVVRIEREVSVTERHRTIKVGGRCGPRWTPWAAIAATGPIQRYHSPTVPRSRARRSGAAVRS